MNQTSIEEWVNQDSEKPPRIFRQAIYTILFAISHSKMLREMMVMKGGILLALLYKGRRYTKDIDFSTKLVYPEFQKQVFIEEFSNCLQYAVNSLDYGLDCRIQTSKIDPKNQPEPTFPNLRITIGYAYKGSKVHRHLREGKVSSIIPVDFSFNEKNHKVEKVEIIDEKPILVYSLTDLIVEKFRAILQQEIRNRVRRQDVYDLYRLFEVYPNLTYEDKEKILFSLKMKSESRNLSIHRNSMDNPEIKKRTEKEYPSLQNEIPDPLPPFEEVFQTVLQFYTSLPWK